MSNADVFPFPILPADFGSSSSNYVRRREKCPMGRVILPSGDQALLLVGYNDVAQVLRSKHFSRDLRAPSAPRVFEGLDMSSNPNLLINLDPPAHTRLRRLVQKAFNPVKISEWQSAIHGIVTRLIDDLIADGPPQDLVKALTSPLAMHAICEIIGVQETGRQIFANWKQGFFSTASAQERLRSGGLFLRRISDLVQACRANPGDGLIDRLVAIQDNAGGLTEPELRHMISTLFIAGYENTSATIARGVFALMRNPPQYKAICADLSIADLAVEEILRYEIASESALLRVASADVTLPSGQVPAGTAVLPCIPAANRDPSYFARPDRFDIHRTQNPHLSFGAGPHFCLGAELARLELSIALKELARRVPSLRLACPAEDVVFTAHSLVRSPLCVPVAW